MIERWGGGAKRGSPAEAAAYQLKSIISSGEADTYHQAHNILHGRDRYHNSAYGRQIPREQRTPAETRNRTISGFRLSILGDRPEINL